MAISRILGASLVSDLDRQGVDLQFSTSGNALVYMDFVNFRLGINQTNPQQALHVNGNVLVANGSILTSGNLTYDIGSTTNWFRNVYANNIAAGSFTSNTLTGTLLTNAQPNITSVGTLANLTVSGNLSAANIAGTLTTAAQPNITSVGNLTTLRVTGQLTSTVANGTAPFVISSNTQVANLYSARAGYADQVTTTTSDSATVYYLTGVNSSATGNYGLVSTPQISFNASTDILTATGFAGTLQTAAQPNVTSLGTLTGLTVAGNVNITLGNLQPSANLTSSLGFVNRWWGAVFANTVTATGYNGTILTGNQPNITNLANVYINNVTIGTSINLPSNVTVGTINANVINENGNRVLTAASNIVITGSDISGNGTASNIVVTLSNTGVTPGVYGSADDEFADRIPKITVDAKGRITNIANVTLTQVGNVSFNNTTISANASLNISSLGNINLDAQGTGIVRIVGADAIKIPHGDVSDRPNNPETGYFRFNTETQNIEVFDGNIWSGPDSAIISSEIITPNGTSAAFAISAIGASTGGVLVSINGTLQQPFTSYNIDNDQIIFTEVPAASDIIEIRSLSTGSVVSASQLRTSGANVILTSGNITISGNLIPSADVTYNIGSATNQWNDLYLSGNTIYLGGATLKTNGSSLEFTPAGSGSIISLTGDTDPSSISNGASNIRVTSNYVNVAVNSSNVVSISSAGLTTTGNISATYIIGNGSLLTGVYANTNAAAYLTTYNGTIATVTTANTNLKGYTDNLVTTANTNMKGYVDNINSTLTANAAVQAGNIATIQSTYARLSGATFTGAVSAPNITLTTALPITSGGTGANTATRALQNLLPNSVSSSGYVLTANGDGTFYWEVPQAGPEGTFETSYETLNKNLSAYNYVINRSGSTITSIVYTLPNTQTITKAFTYNGSGQITSMSISGVPLGSTVYTKNLAYSGTFVSGASYSIL